MGHRYRVTASGVVRNDASATVSLNYNRPVTVAVDRSQTILDDVRVSGQVDASGTASWTASGYYTFYGDTRHWQPSLTATVEGWSWSDYKYRDCPR